MALPMALAAATSGVVRRHVLGLGPLFPTPLHPKFITPDGRPGGMLGCLLVGLLASVLSGGLIFFV